MGSIKGIRIYIHATFLLLLLWVGISHWRASKDVWDVAFQLVFLCALFGCVLLHELGHALTALRYGIKTKDITLLPIGGLARLERIPENPRQELMVALAGPAVNFVIAGVLFVGLFFLPASVAEPAGRLDARQFVSQMLQVNILLAVFNLLPAFPMDGGRVLRAILATRMDYARATRMAASLGQAMAFLFGLIGFMFNPFLLFIALFVWIGASQEASLAEMKTVLGGVPVEGAMLTDFRELRPSDPLQRAVELILAGFQQDFPVVEEGRLLGILTRSDLMVALAKQGPETLVSDVMRTTYQSLEASELLESVFSKVQNSECRTLPVLRYGRLVGLINLENIGEFVMIRSALDTPGQARPVFAARTLLG